MELARLNAAKAGLAGKIGFEVSPFSSAKLPESGIIITNPPYGERMGDIESARRLYAELGRRVRERESLGVYVLSPDERFERFFGRRADKKRKLYNLMIARVVYVYGEEYSEEVRVKS